MTKKSQHKKINTPVPFDLHAGYFMPAEWAPHRASLIAWPHQREDWPGKFAPIDWVYTEIVKKLTASEPVLCIVRDKEQLQGIKKKLEKSGMGGHPVLFIRQKTNRSWMRDSAPIFVKRTPDPETPASDDDTGEPGTIALGFTFNGWAKYDNYKKDALTPNTIANVLDLPLIQASWNGKPIVLEGGAFDVNGNGTLIATEECLLDEQTQPRNPWFTKEDYLALFKEYLGITNVIWLGKGIAGDDTHGHIDDVCRFVNPTTLVLCSETNSADPNYLVLSENAERLESALLESGSKPNIIKLPMPQPIVFDGMLVPASYANFYIANSVVLVPTFNDPNDRIALGILAEVFPDKQVIGIHSVDLIWGLGTLHCLTMQVPL